MEEDIKILEEMIKARKDHMKNYEKSGCYTNTYFTLKAEIQAIENLINRNKELGERDRANRKVIREYSDCIPKSKAKEKQIKENEIRRNRFLYGNYECPSESYKYKYTDIDMNDYAGMEVNRVLQELLED